ncbi:MAG: hypothetical protein P8X50_08035 [Maritimibacter sp.]
MKRIFDKLVYSDDGAVAVDWIVLTAGIVGMCVALIQIFDVAFSNFASDKIVAAFDVLSAYVHDVFS